MLQERTKAPFALLMVVALALLAGFRATGEAYDFSGWEQGAAGYESAAKTALDREEPLVIYFSTEWCGWCKKLNQMYLESADVQKTLAPLHKVAVNPDKGSAEKVLQSKFGVRGFPAFLVTVPAAGGNPVKIHPFMSTGFVTTAQFVNAINLTIERQYNDKGAALIGKKEFDQAVKNFEKALTYYSKDPNVHYNMGLAYGEMARKEKDLELLAKAEQSYQAALDIDANHQRAQRELQWVRERRSEWEKQSKPAAKSEK